MLPSTVHAQLGEFAGHMVFNVTLGQSETLQWTIFNSGEYPITWNAVAPSITINNVSGISSSNRTFPIITLSPSGGTLTPRENQVINVTVYMPAKNNTGGLSWEAIPQVVEVTNNSNPGGATIQVGVAKILAINAVNPQPDYLIYVGAIIVIVAVGGAVYYLKNKNRAHTTRRGKAHAKVAATSTAIRSRRSKDAQRTRRKRTTTRTQKKRSGKVQKKARKISRTTSARNKANTRSRRR